MTDMDTATTSNNATTMIWQNLTTWIRQHGGEIHPALELRSIDKGMKNRGVFCNSPIATGETLLRIPCVLDGRHLPAVYSVKINKTDDENNHSQQPAKRKASPWLRCLAAYYQAHNDALQSPPPPPSSSSSSSQHKDFALYLQSLPAQYETVAAAWTDDQVNTYLAGTSTQGGSSVAWHLTADELRQRYTTQVQPYLQACGIRPVTAAGASTGGGHTDDDTAVAADAISEAELQTFQTALSCLSTRAFHLQKEEEESTDNKAAGNSKVAANDDEEEYTGPFLIPVVDLLNHASSTSDKEHVTTLHRTADDCFVCVAEKDLVAHQQVLHSYGDSLTSSQYLQTFGFVPLQHMQRMMSYHCHNKGKQQEKNDEEETQSTPAALFFPPLTPALLRKQDVLETAWQVIESDVPTRLAERMQDMEDEVWTVKVDRSRTADFISADLIVNHHDDGIIADEIVTAATVAFLPICAYREAAQALLGAEILEDFFLGHLVCTTLLRVLMAKLETYPPISWQGRVYEDDGALLQQCLSQQGGDSDKEEEQAHQLRLQYGLTIRLEEKACLQSLRQSVVETLARLQASVDDDDTDPNKNSDEDNNEDVDQSTKKQKIQE